MVSSEANELITKAKRYLEPAKISLEKDYYCEVCFLSSLASVLYFKGLSIALTGSFPTVHDLRIILNHIKTVTNDERIDRFVRENRSKLKSLSDEYLVSRYNMSISYERDDAEECINVAIEVINFAEGLLHKVS
ncbi:HEPN domain-containing protein [Stygiolobus sp. RP850M]|uniref:HEPN domain-containing protein n=1 Tax=Stygiolobus sp. RP850M TaxID=3133137 RepID=UPI00307F490A